MIKRPFFGLVAPQLEYAGLDTAGAPQEVPAPSRITLFVDAPLNRTDSLMIAKGDAVKRGQKVVPFANSPAYTVSPRGGTIASIVSYTGNFGKKLTAVVIEVDENTEADNKFAEAGKTPSKESAAEFLGAIPGGLPRELVDVETVPETVVVAGADEDFLSVTRQYTISSNMEGVKRGVEILKKITGAKNIVLAVPGPLAAGASSAGAEVKTVGDQYPAANPHMIAKDCLGKVIPAGKSCADEGIVFISPEAVAAVGQAYAEGTVSDRKLVTVVKKSGEKKLLSAVIGTAVGEVLAACNESVDENDRLVLGGPMTGDAVYTESYPVCTDTDLILVQDATQIPDVADNACINCGACVRICPARIPVNVLIRYLEAGSYGDAADNHDLLSCIECGLCSFVCTAHIPIFQYIKLGKYEFARSIAAEADNAQ
ncbi:MAG: 4Fe-4S dicluster domain-containing protein [Thermodesulfobacteriota bacterium]|nr:4Fe-4S dicluster domain-containing protein [Thermodesulfobacteriota bacterium]